MTDFNVSIEKLYGRSGLLGRILDGLSLLDKNLDGLKVEDLSPVDEFHTRGRESTLEVTALTNIKASDLVLEVGCGLGGTARYLADRYMCSVIGIDLTKEYIDVGRKLTEIVGLANQVKLQQGNALNLPYEDEMFDIVWTEHVQMNISDKNRFYSEISRVLKPKGRFLFHDIFYGINGFPYYPVPWAEEYSMSSLVTEDEARLNIEKAGLRIDNWINKLEESVEYFKKVLTKIETDGYPPLGIHLLMGHSAKEKLHNYHSNLLENRVTVSLGSAHKYPQQKKVDNLSLNEITISP